jgi:hypothetical protein
MTTARTILDLELCLDDTNSESQQNHSDCYVIILGTIRKQGYGSDEINDE